MKKAAVINDLSGFGKCSLTVALPVLSALGVQCCPLPTAVLTGQTGFPYYHCTDLTKMIPKYTDAWLKNNAHFDAIYSGYMTGMEQISEVLDFLAHFHGADTFLLVDPVMGDDGRVYDIYSPWLLEGMKKLSRQADIITPNLTEACLLADTPPELASRMPDGTEALDAARALAKTLRTLANRPQDVVITGIRCLEGNTPVICNLALTEDGEHLCRSHAFAQSYSGTGDLFASVLCGCRARGMDMARALALATDFLYNCIADTAQTAIDRNNGVFFEQHLIELIQGVLEI